MNDHEKTSTPAEVLHYSVFGSLAEGAIEANENLTKRLNEFTERVKGGEFHETTAKTLPCGCIDGRCGCQVRPNAAGGSLSLAVADDLTFRHFAGEHGTTAETVQNVMRDLKTRGLSIGGHTAEDTHGAENSGCGANDKLPQIYDILQRKADDIRALAAAFQVEPTDDDHAAIIVAASRRSEFSSGRDVFRAMTRVADSADIDTLEGGHREVIAVINNRTGTTLNRDKLKQEFGQNYQAFNIDAWSFKEGAMALYPNANGADIDRVVTAMVYYNIATSLALCGPTMRVVTLND